MFDRDAWLEVAHNVLANPLRTTLTGISVALGIFILVVMQGLGYGLQNGVEATCGRRGQQHLGGRRSHPNGVPRSPTQPAHQIDQRRRHRTVVASRHGAGIVQRNSTLGR